MVTLYKLLIVEMDINLSRLLINQESENVSLSMLEFQAYTWPSYLFYELKAMLCCVYVKNYFPRYFLCWFNAKAYCLSMIRRMEKWHNDLLRCIMIFLDFYRSGVKVDQIL